MYFTNLLWSNKQVCGHVQIKMGVLGQLHVLTLEIFLGSGIQFDNHRPCHWKSWKDFQQRPVFGKILPFWGYE